MSSNLPLLVLDVGPIILLYIDIHKAKTLVFLVFNNNNNNNTDDDDDNNNNNNNNSIDNLAS
jgi:hypothetical protein